MNFLRRTFSRRKWESELSEELRFHIEQQTAANIAAGMTREEARRQAMLSLGGVDGLKDSCREERRGFWLESLWADIRHGARVLRKSPGFTSIAILTLALGIGANTAIFSLIDALLLRELPVREPAQLVQITTMDAARERGSAFSLPMFQELEKHQQVFSGMFGWYGDGIFNVAINGENTTGDIWAVTGNFYSTLGVTPYLGRLIAPADVDLQGGAAPQAAVLGHEFWQRRFGGDPAAIGKMVRIEDHPFTIIGVTRKWFTGMTVGAAPDITVPLNAKSLIEEGHTLDDRSSMWVSAAGRLKEGVTLSQARAQITTLWPAVQAETVATGLSAERRAAFFSTRVDVTSAARGYEWFFRSAYTQPLYVLLGLAGLVLLIACVNLANMLLARAAARTHEMGMRIALGASRWRLTRQLLTESLLLSLAGAALGLAFSYWGSWTLVNSIWHGLVPLVINFSPDVRILAFTAGVAILTGVLFGLAPAWRATSQDPLSVLQQTARVSGGRSGKVAKLLICTQVALSLVLLAGAGLFVRSLANLRSIQPGYQSRGVLLAELYPLAGEAKKLNGEVYFPELLSRISALPGVQSASLSDVRPAWGFGGKESVSAEPSEPGAVESPKFNYGDVTPQFFETLGMNLIEGRFFNSRDDAHSPQVAILSQTLARKLFPSGVALGRRVRIGSGTEHRNVEVVGIVNDARIFDVHDSELGAVYMPFMQDLAYAPWATLEVKTTEDPEAMAFPVRREIEQLGHEFVLETQTLSEEKDIALSRERVIVRISVFFGSLALLLASLGLFGLMSYFVRGRTHEIGIRIALGAQRTDVGSMILRETLLLVLAGVAIGIPCALAATRVFASLLYGLSPRDPVTLAIVALTLLLVGAAAAWLPARRAMRVDPMVALRYE
jgi:predicted permease